MTVHQTRALVLAAVLIGIGAIASTSLHAQQTLAERTLDELRVLAEQGDAVAQFNLGLIYLDGLGVTPDYIEARRWWRASAEQGSADAQFGFGVS